MCYSVYLSTNSALDLANEGFEPVSFVPVPGLHPTDELCLSNLQYSSKWFVSTYGGCSCHLRHAIQPEELFEPPVDWAPEEPEDIASTARLYDLVVRLIQEGAQVDLLDVWEGSEENEPFSHEISLSTVSRGSFRLVEGVRMNFKA